MELSGVLSTITTTSQRVAPQLLSSFTPHNVFQAFVTEDAVVTSYWLAINLIILQILYSFVTRTISCNDRLWPIIPLLHALLYATHVILSSTSLSLSINSPRVLRPCLMALLVTFWSIRLTLHAIKRGVYAKNAVDYRYDWLRNKVITNPYIYGVFHSIVVCGMFTILLSFVCGAPMHIAVTVGANIPLNVIDAIATLSMITAILLETIADRQQQTFQLAKRRNETNDKFLQHGLFAHCRHPNFFAELATWFSFYVFTISSGASLVNWTIAGPLVYTTLFQGSTSITEHLACKKYPAYKSYQKNVSRLWFSVIPRRRIRNEPSEKSE